MARLPALMSERSLGLVVSWNLKLGIFPAPYLDRICIMRVQGDIERELGLGQLTTADEQRLRDRGFENNPDSRAKLTKDRATERMSWVFSAFVAGYVLFEVSGGWLGDRWGAR